MKRKDYSKPISIASGTLILLGIIAGIASIVPSVEGNHFLCEIYTHRGQVRTGAVFQLLLVPIYIGFSLLMYSIFRKEFPTLSLGFVGWRCIAGTFQLAGTLLLPMLIFISGQYSTVSPLESAAYESLGDFLLLIRNLVNHLGVIFATAVSNMLLYSMFIRNQSIPRWLSGWGIVGNLVLLLSCLLLLYDLVEVVSVTYGLLTLPLVFQEIVLAIWLITQRLKTTPITTQPC